MADEKGLDQPGQALEELLGATRQRRWSEAGGRGEEEGGRREVHTHLQQQRLLRELQQVSIVSSLEHAVDSLNTPEQLNDVEQCMRRSADNGLPQNTCCRAYT